MKEKVVNFIIWMTVARYPVELHLVHIASSIGRGRSAVSPRSSSHYFNAIFQQSLIVMLCYQLIILQIVQFCTYLFREVAGGLAVVAIHFQV